MTNNDLMTILPVVIVIGSAVVLLLADLWIPDKQKGITTFLAALALGLAEAFGTRHGVPGLGRFSPVLKDVALPTAPEAWVADGRPRAVLVPGASRRGAIKRWPLRHWRTLARMIQDGWVTASAARASASCRARIHSMARRLASLRSGEIGCRE